LFIKSDEKIRQMYICLCDRPSILESISKTSQQIDLQNLYMK
jgi:hypothetical protein